MSNGSDKKIESRVSILALFASLVAIVISVFSLIQDRKEHQLDELITLYNFLHEQSESDARYFVCAPDFQDKTFTTNVHRVCSSFDFAATVIKNDAIDEEAFIAYWGDELCAINDNFSTNKLWDFPVVKGRSIRQFYPSFDWLVKEAEKRRADTRSPHNGDGL